MDIQTRYNKIFKSHFINEKINERGDDGDAFSSHYKRIWSLESPEWKEYIKNNDGKRHIIFLEGKEVFSTEWEVENLDEVKKCYVMFLFEDIK